jgi:mycothiol S-conjugate amidase
MSSPAEPRIAPLVDLDSVSAGPEDVLRIVALHAHPDDESSKGAGTIARYTDAGAHAVLVTCTGGEAGDVLNPAMDRPEVKENLPAIRRAELAAAAGVIGYAEVVLLGYRDSGMPDTPANADPRAFANAPLDEVAKRIVAIIRKVRPHVILTYGDDQRGYPHPDHLRVHDVSLPVFEGAADPDAYSDTGEPWQALKMYYSAWSRGRVLAFHEKFKELGLESPYDDRWFKRPNNDERITTRVDISGLYERRKQALLAHATQIDPSSKFWFGLPDEVAATVYPQEDWVLARSLVETSLPETDLFAGIREPVT